jgi:hypothetical protein
MRNSEKTFHWIINILKKHAIPFVITGGLAGKCFGSPRPLNDIDIDIHDKDFDRILEDIKPYIIFGPGRYRNERWDLLLMTLNHEGQEIDISGGDTLHICDARTNKWEFSPTDFSDIEHRTLFDSTVPVISRGDLIAYKSMLQGAHQHIDIHAAQNASN